jgi:hypothetical protein
MIDTTGLTHPALDKITRITPNICCSSRVVWARPASTYDLFGAVLAATPADRAYRQNGGYARGDYSLAL